MSEKRKIMRALRERQEKGLLHVIVRHIEPVFVVVEDPALRLIGWGIARYKPGDPQPKSEKLGTEIAVGKALAQMAEQTRQLGLGASWVRKATSIAEVDDNDVPF